MSDPKPLLADIDRKRLRHLRELGLEMRCFYDVGASNGRWSNQVSEDFPEAHFELFEPLVDHVADYQAEVEDTVSRHPRFCLHKVALGSKCQRTTLFAHKNPAGSTALALGRGVSPDWRRLEVEMLTLDHVVTVLGRPQPQVIKIDTQGCELNILEGARKILPQVSVLLLECWLSRGYGRLTPLFEEILAWLQPFGFHLWDFAGCWRDDTGTLVSQDCLFLNAHCPVSRLKDDPAQAPILAPVPSAPVNVKPRWRQSLAGIWRIRSRTLPHPG